MINKHQSREPKWEASTRNPETHSHKQDTCTKNNVYQARAAGEEKKKRQAHHKYKKNDCIVMTNCLQSSRWIQYNQTLSETVRDRYFFLYINKWYAWFFFPACSPGLLRISSALFSLYGILLSWWNRDERWSGASVSLQSKHDRTNLFLELDLILSLVPLSNILWFYHNFRRQGNFFKDFRIQVVCTRLQSKWWNQYLC